MKWFLLVLVALAIVVSGCKAAEIEDAYGVCPVACEPTQAYFSSDNTPEPCMVNKAFVGKEVNGNECPGSFEYGQNRLGSCTCLEKPLNKNPCPINCTTSSGFECRLKGTEFSDLIGKTGPTCVGRVIDSTGQISTTFPLTCTCS